MFCYIIFDIFASELINLEIKYLYMYLFGRSCSTWIWSLSKLLSILGMEIIPHAFLSASRILLSTPSCKEAIEAFL